MYYKGMPFVERNIIDECDILSSHPTYFKKEDQNLNFADKVFVRYNSLSKEIRLVVYLNAQWNNPLLIEYHNKHYLDIPYFVQEMFTTRTIRTTIVKEGQIVGYKINHHTEDWLETIEQSYDAYFSLIEYREFLYEKNSDIIIGENIFYALSWLINKEKYD